MVNLVDGTAVRPTSSIDWRDPIVASSCNPRHQELIILPTEKCNFRCTYCYEDFALGSMNEATQRGIERLMAVRIPELQRLSIQWFGGEPLVARQVVLRLSKYAKSLCDLHGTLLSGALTTNAWLLSFDLFEELLSYDQRFFQITLDGPEEFHDRYRKRANGKGTFEKIWSNLLALRSSPENFTVQLRIHVRRGAVDALLPLLSAIAEDFGNDSRFGLDFEHIRNLGGAGGLTVGETLSLQELKEIEFELRRYYEEQRSSSMPSKQANGTSSYTRDSAPRSYNDLAICYASKANSLLIRSDGRIGKCTVALTDGRNTIGKLNEDGTLTIDPAKLQPWIRGLKSGKESELACPLVGLP